MQTSDNEPLNQNIKVIRESSVFSDIQKSVQTKDKSAFSLLLAMVTEDKMELDAFHLPANKVPKNKFDLEKTFHVVPQKLIGTVNIKQDLIFNELISSGNRESVNLLLNLQPQPLITKNDDIDSGVNLPAQLLNSLNINQKAKLYKDIQLQEHVNNLALSNSKNEGESLITEVNSDVEMDITSWFSVLEQARTLSKVA